MENGKRKPDGQSMKNLQNLIDISTRKSKNPFACLFIFKRYAEEKLKYNF